ncbi:MAG: hypothetical protein HXY50_01960 [Ignavibacteriaceae bacterium]|nr:hypothetical protein [Ignavibacteriaceae bacterium]
MNQYQCSTCSLKVTKTTGQGSYGQLWANISNTNTIVSSYRYDSSTPVISAALKDAIIAALSSGTLYLGSLSLVEGANNSYASLELRLIVDYTVPPSNVSITADNNFTAAGGSNHGTMVIDGVNQTIPLTGYTFSKTVGQNLTLSANSPQNDNQGYQRIWHTGATNPSNWTRNGEFRWSNQTYSFTVAADDNGKRYVANLRKICKPNFQNSFVGAGNGGVIKVNNTPYISPTIQFNVIELNSISGTALYQVINGIEYTFFQWSDGSTNATKTFNPSSTQTYTAYFTSKPSTANRNLHTGTNYGQPIVL